MCAQPVHACWSGWVRCCAVPAPDVHVPPLLEHPDVCDALLSDMVRVGVELGDAGARVIDAVRCKIKCVVCAQCDCRC